MSVENWAAGQLALPGFEPDQPDPPWSAAPAGSGSPAFDTLREHFATDLALHREFEQLLVHLLTKHNPTDHGDRFLVGQAGEALLAIAGRAALLDLHPDGHDAIGYDLRSVTTGEKWSVKTSYSRGGDFGISNGQGGAGAGMTHPTVFWSPCLPGIIYADPERHPWIRAGLVAKADSVRLPKKIIAAHAKGHPECLIPMTIPPNMGDAPKQDELAIAISLIQEGAYPTFLSLLS
jgi:hypothetical protein